MRVLFFGGSFDPPHAGHLALLRAGVRELSPDEVVLVPSFLSPFKSRHGAAPAERIELAARLAGLCRAPRSTSLQVLDFEVRRGRRTFTIDVLRMWRRTRPGDELWWLAGSDTLAQWRSWRRPDELARLCRWAAGARPGTPWPRGIPPGTRRLKGLFPEISSTDVRARLWAGLPVEDSVPASVLAHIRTRRLYGGEVHRALSKGLSPERWRHTLGVARLARGLALAHGLDEESAARAGILHDCGRLLDPAAMARLARRRRLRVPARAETLRRAPLLAHAFVSEHLARERFGETDEGVLSAVRNHTLGAPGMARLDRLLYVADIASEDRGFPEAARIRTLAFEDLDAAYREAVRAKLAWVLTGGNWLHPAGPLLWNSLLAP